MKFEKERVRKVFDECINADEASPDALRFVESLKVDGNIDTGLAVYALAFYSGLEAAEKITKQ